MIKGIGFFQPSQRGYAKRMPQLFLRKTRPVVTMEPVIWENRCAGIGCKLPKKPMFSLNTRPILIAVLFFWSAWSLLLVRITCISNGDARLLHSKLFAGGSTHASARRDQTL